MSNSINKINHVQALSTYQKASNKFASNFAKTVDSIQDVYIKASNEANILRSGDTIEIAKQPANSNTSSNTQTFSKSVQNAVKSKIDDIKKAEAVAEQAIEGDADLVQIMSAMNESEVTLNEIVQIRDTFIRNLQEILRMPL